MIWVGALAIAAIALTRFWYGMIVERRQLRRFSMDADGIVAGAGPIDLPLAGAPGVLLIHGGGDTPQSLASLAAFLHARGYAVRVPLLSGHGRSVRSLCHVRASEWHSEVEREFEKMLVAHKTVGVVGLSMGGALALDLASRHRDLPALVLLAPYVEMPPMLRHLAFTAPAWRLLLPYFSSRGERSIHDPLAAGEALGSGILTPAALRALHDVVNDATRALPRVTTPTLVVHSRSDNRISPAAAERGFARLGASEKRLEWTAEAGHVITVDYGYASVFEMTAEWLDAHLERPVRGGPATIPERAPRDFRSNP